MQTTKDIKETLEATKNLMDVGVALLKAKPAVLPSLRMSTCPPLAVDRLIGLAGISANLVKAMEKNNRLPPRMPRRKLDSDLAKIGKIIEKMADPDVLSGWSARTIHPGKNCTGLRLS